jgi:hypothetical protein
MDTLFYKIIKTFFVLPLLVLKVLKKSFTQSVSEFYDISIIQFKEATDPIKAWVKQLKVDVIDKIKNLIKFMIKIAFIFGIILLNSLLFCVFINYLLYIPQNKSKELEFSFTDDNKYIKSELIFNHDNFKCTNCIELEKYTYSFEIDLEFANKAYPENTDNYQLELQMIHSKGEKTVKKLFYFDKYDSIFELLNKLFTLPFRLFGFFNSKKFDFIMVEEFDNADTNLIKIDFLIKSKSINVKHCVFKFVPQVSWLMKFFNYIKMVALPILFMTIITYQIFGVLILYLFFNKIKPLETSEKTRPIIEETIITNKENMFEDSTTTVYTEASVLQDLQEQSGENLNK